MIGLAEGVGVALLVGFARRRVLRAQPFEVIPAAIIFGGVGQAEIPAVGAVRRFRRGPVAGLVAAVPVALAHGLGLARGAVGAPAGKAPVIRSFCLGHRIVQNRESGGCAPPRRRQFRRKNARGPVSRVLSTAFAQRWATIPLGDGSRRRSSNQPGRRAGTGPYATPIRSCSRWGLPCRRRYRKRGGLLPHPFDLAGPKPGGLLSVALSLGSPPPAINRHRRSVEPGLSSPRLRGPRPPGPLAEAKRLPSAPKRSHRPPRPRQQQGQQDRAAFAVDRAVDQLGPEAALEGDGRRQRGASTS